MTPDPLIIPIVSVVAVAVLLRPIVRAWARRLEGGASSADLSDQVAHLQERLADLESLAARMPELEERLDFAERILSERRDAARLPASVDKP